MIETIEENTMGTLDEVATGMASMGIGRYALPNGSMVQGMSCVLAPVEQENVIIGIGSVVEVQGVQWEVVRIKKSPGEPGFVTLQRWGNVAPGDNLKRANLDFRFSTSCPRCGELAGWNGGIEEELGEPVMSMECLYCGDEFVWYNGTLAKVLKSEPPEFMPGAEAAIQGS
jgi:hypothetical protein